MHRAIAAAMLFLVGCAGVTYEPETNDSKGIRYYRSAPYLLVYTDNDKGLKTELVYLPDTRTVLTAYPYSTLATNSTTLEFSNGILQSAESQIDQTVIPQAVLSALEKVAVATIGAFRKAEDKTGLVPAPRLYRIAWDEQNRAYLIGPNGCEPGGISTDIRVAGKTEADGTELPAGCEPPQMKPASPPPPNAPHGGAR